MSDKENCLANIGIFLSPDKKTKDDEDCDYCSPCVKGIRLYCRRIQLENCNFTILEYFCEICASVELIYELVRRLNKKDKITFNNSTDLSKTIVIDETDLPETIVIDE